MKYISGQHYVDWEIVERKMEALKGKDKVIIPFYLAGIVEDDDGGSDEYAVQADGHHTLAAARELGLEIEYEVTNHPEGLTGMQLLEKMQDADYYYVDTSRPEYDQLDLVW